jgi:DNA-binding transcriptional MerR regulator
MTAGNGLNGAPPRPDQNGGDAAEAGRVRLKKAPNAFRTISEVADDLHIPQHVLRFWETKFPQVKPLKRGGGRRYYRPDDIALLRRISDLLYIQGYTIKGVQRLLREGGGRLSDDIPPATADERAAAAAEAAEAARAASERPASELPIPGLSRPAQLQPADRVARTWPEVEAERLRTVLSHTLRELEALRALLP